MADEFRSIRDSLFKVFTNLATSQTDDPKDSASKDSDNIDSGTRALLGALFAKAGKSKDEVVQILAREIGMAVAAMLKEPLAILAKNQKLQISFEFVPKDKEAQPSKNHPGKRRRHTAPKSKIARKTPQKI